MMQKGIMKRIMEDPVLLRNFKKYKKQKEEEKKQQKQFGKQLDLFEDAVDKTKRSKNNEQKENKTVVKIRAYTRKTKKGKIVYVKDFYRKNKFISNFKKLKSSLLTKNIEPKKIKIELTKLIIRDLGVKDKDKIKKIYNSFSKLLVTKPLQQQKNGTIIKTKKEVITTAANSKHNKIKIDKSKNKSKFYFGYLGSGDILEKEEKDLKNFLQEGYAFYNQNISSDKNWKETLTRKDLKILRIDKIVDSENKIQVSLLKNINGKIITKKKEFTKPQLLKFIKEGKG